MSKSKLLSIVVFVLLACNILLLYHIWNKSPERGGKGAGPRSEIIKRLHFDAEQVQEYDILVQQHRNQIGGKNEEIRQLKKELYSSLSGNAVNQDSLIQLLGDKQKEIEQINLIHFADIGKLCTADQKADYHALVVDLSELFMPKRKMKKH